MKAKVMLIALILAALPASAAPLGVFPANVVRVLDGDTFEAVIPLWQIPRITLQTRIRVFGIDTPELLAKQTCERELATKSKSYAMTLLPAGALVTLSIESADKFSNRYDARVNIGGQDYGAAIVAAGFARIYTGGIRLPWC
jgi:micrococcal nuclease